MLIRPDSPKSELWRDTHTTDNLAFHPLSIKIYKVTEILYYKKFHNKCVYSTAYKGRKYDFKTFYFDVDYEDDLNNFLTMLDGRKIILFTIVGLNENVTAITYAIIDEDN